LIFKKILLQKIATDLLAFLVLLVPLNANFEHQFHIDATRVDLHFGVAASKMDLTTAIRFKITCVLDNNVDGPPSQDAVHCCLPIFFIRKDMQASSRGTTSKPEPDICCLSHSSEIMTHR